MWLQKCLTSKDTPIAQNNLEEVVRCNTCCCLVEKSWAQSVRNEYYCETLYYCIGHRKPYKRITGNEEMGYQYFGEVEMSEDGKPI